MKTKRKILSALLATVMAIMLVPTTAFAATYSANPWTGSGTATDAGNGWYLLKGDETVPNMMYGPNASFSYLNDGTLDLSAGFTMSASIDTTTVAENEDFAWSFGLSEVFRTEDPEEYNYLNEIAFHFRGVAGGKAKLMNLQSNVDAAEGHDAEDGIQNEAFDGILSEDGIYDLSVKFVPGESDTLLATVIVNGTAVITDFVMPDAYSDVLGPRYGWMFQCTPAAGVKVTLPVVETLAGDHEVSAPVIDPSKPVEDVTVAPVIDETTEEMLKDSGSEELQAAIAEAILAGKDVVTSVEVSSIDLNNVPDEIVADIDAAKKAALTEKLEIAEVLDLSVLVKADGATLGTITNTKAPLTFQIAVPEDLKKEGRTFAIIRIHEGKADVLNTVESNGLLTFTTDKFSTYALAYKDASATGTTDSTDKDTGVENPKSGDNSGLALWAVLLFVSGGAVIGTASYNRMKKSSK